MQVLFAAALAAAAIQQPTAPAVAPSDNLVRVDAFVVDARGRALDTLQASDFDLQEDGVRQTIEGVRFLRSESGLPPSDALPAVTSDVDEQREAARAGARLFAIYLDEYHVAADTAERLREPLRQFIDRDLGPRDLLIVMKPLDSLLAIRLTHDRAAARQAVSTFTGRKGDYTARDTYERQYMAASPAAVDQMRMQVTVSALNALAVHLGWTSADARKALIVVSEGLGTAERRRNLDLPTLASVVQSANRSNVAVYSVDPAETPADASGEEALGHIARETDGLSISAASAREGGLHRIAADSSAYYLITYRSPGRTDNRFHGIQLRVKRPGANVRTRAGYWALSPDDMLRAEMLAAAEAPKVVKAPEPSPRVSPLIRPWFGVSRGLDGKTRVTFVWERAPAVPGVRSRVVASRLVFTALGANGEPAFEATVLPVGGGALEGVDASERRAEFEVTPGRVRIRMSIEDAGLRVIDSDVRDIAVRDLGAPVALGTPQILRARNAREFRKLDADPQAAPVASRVFSRTEHLIVRVPAYAADGQPVVSATLMSRMGQPMRSLAVRPPSTPDGQNEVDLPLAGFATGDYQIELTATSPAGQASDRVSFRVTS